MSSPQPKQRDDTAVEGEPAAAQAAIDSLESIIGSVLTTVKENTDNWLNSGWSVKKRAGQWIPEVRPNTADIASRTAQLLPAVDDDGAIADPASRAVNGSSDLAAVTAAGEVDRGAGAGGAVVDLSAARESSLAAASPRELQGEFLDFLKSREEAGDFRTSWSGEIVFSSRQRLAQLVAQFSYAKLKQISAAARALARYVDDLESELEHADIEAVQLRTQLRDAVRAASEREARVTELSQRASEVEGQLGLAQAELDAGERELRDAEARAESAAEEVLELQARVREAEQRGQSVEDQKAQAEQLGIKFEEQLLDAERKALAFERAQRKLASELEQLQRERALADERAASASELAAAMEQRTLAAESIAERKASELDNVLRQREQNARRLQEAMAALEERLAEAREGGGGVDSIEPLDVEAKRLRAELRDVLDIEHLDSAAASDASGPDDAAGQGQLRLPPLSRMRKAELIAECEGYAIDASGTVAELRARLRTERKRRKAEQAGAAQGGPEPSSSSVGVA